MFFFPKIVCDPRLPNSYALALLAPRGGSAAHPAMPFIEDDLLWCPDNDGRMVDLNLGVPGTEELTNVDNVGANGDGQQPANSTAPDLPGPSVELNAIDPSLCNDLDLDFDNLLDFPVNINEIKEENNNDLGVENEGQEYLNELPSSSNSLSLNTIQAQQHLLGVLLQQQQQQQSQTSSSHRYSIAANPLLAEKLLSPNITNLDSIVTSTRGRPPDIKGNCFSFI